MEKSLILPLLFDTAARSGATRDRMGNFVYTGLPNLVIAHNDRGRGYIGVGLEFERYLDGRAWLALAPLEPLRPGDPLPRRMAFDMEMSLETVQTSCNAVSFRPVEGDGP